MIEAGIYRARAVEASPSRASTGNEQFVVKFNIAEGEHSGESIVWYATLTNKTEKRILAGLMHCGWDGESEDFRGITANEVEIEVRIENDLQGQPRAKVYGVIVPGLSVPNELLGSERANFFGRMKSKAALLKEQLAAAAPRGGPRSGDDAFPY